MALQDDTPTWSRWHGKRQPTDRQIALFFRYQDLWHDLDEESWAWRALDTMIGAMYRAWLDPDTAPPWTP